MASRKRPAIAEPRHVETARPLQRLCAETLVRDVAQNCPEAFEQVGLAVQSKEESEYYLGQDECMIWSTSLVDKRFKEKHFNDERVPWHSFGGVDVGVLHSLGLKDEDFLTACQWEAGFCKWPDVGEAEFEPLTLRATEVFKRSSEDGHVSVREESVFVRALRTRYGRNVAKRILRYLERQYEEWLSSARDTGDPCLKVAHRMADGRYRELRLHEKLELLFSLETPAR